MKKFLKIFLLLIVPLVASSQTHLMVIAPNVPAPRPMPDTAAIVSDVPAKVVDNTIAVSDSSCNNEEFWITDKVFAYEGENFILKNDTTLSLFAKSAQSYSLPFHGLITCGYGNGHKGVDIDLETGDSVHAAFDGEIRYAQYNSGGFGNLIIIRHPNGLETYYGHLSEVLVQPEQQVKAGDVIGLGGNTGRSYGSHLHFEIRFHDHTIDPLSVFNFETSSLKSDSVLISVNAYVHPPTSTAKYYIVKKGDSLSRIAQRNHTTVSKLCKLNHITVKKILHPGMKLRIR